ncbi:MAG TPA: NPCBM/NEW2 domain-containing protein [Planctomycetota bacterium]|nr:NPCBM/NEW2 domain-containing protein [Planctomycetota bacterium]
MRLRLSLLIVLLTLAVRADDAILTRGERLEGEVTGGSGGFKIGNQNVAAKDVLVIRFASDPPPVRMPAGVFIRGGSLIAGTLTSVIGADAEISSAAFGALKLKKDDIAGAFSPLAAGQAENMPELARYSALLAATLGTPNAGLQPGKRTRVRFAGLDEVTGDRVMRIGTDQILLTTKGKGVDTIGRQFVRLIELAVPPLPAPTPEDMKLGPEMIVRLKGGDLLRGRVVKLDGKSLVLRTAFLGEKEIERALLAVIFSAGGEGSGVNWLSAQEPKRAVHTPIFDSEFPPRLDASSDGGDMKIKDVPVERGIGCHSKSEIEFALAGTPSRFVALVGIDSETRGRGAVTAHVVADGKEVWKSQVITAKDAPQLISADIGVAKSIVLHVDYGPDADDSGDHFDWGWAAVVGK